MSPRSTFQSCGSSSMLVMRRNRPTRVMRGSCSRSSHSLCRLRSSSSARRASASATIVRNLTTRNGLPPRPIRLWRNSTGPGDSSLTAIAAAIQSGAVMSSSPSAPTMSIARLKIRFERASEGVLMPISVIPSRWSTVAAGPIIEASDGSALIFTPSWRQTLISSNSDSSSTPSADTITRSIPCSIMYAAGSTSASAPASARGSGHSSFSARVSAATGSSPYRGWRSIWRTRIGVIWPLPTNRTRSAPNSLSASLRTSTRNVERERERHHHEGDDLRGRRHTRRAHLEEQRHGHRPQQEGMRQRRDVVDGGIADPPRTGRVHAVGSEQRDPDAAA